MYKSEKYVPKHKYSIEFAYGSRVQTTKTIL